MTTAHRKHDPGSMTGTSPCPWLDDAAHATALADAYLNHGIFGGALWDLATARRRTPTTRDVIDIEDLYAPALLSSPVRRGAAKAIIDRADSITGRLQQIPHRLTLWNVDVSAVDDALGHAHELIVELDAIKHVGSTLASKLVAAKRPDLIPIRDRETAGALHVPPKTPWLDYWHGWRDALDPDTVSTLRQTSIDVGHFGLSPLRTADIIVWMSETGWHQLPKGSTWDELRCACRG